MRICVIAHISGPDPLAALHEQVARLRGDGHEVFPRLTFEAGDAFRFAQKAVSDNAELVIVAGGDGTINEVANGLHACCHAGAAKSRLRPPRIGIIPLGTGNDLAAALKIPAEIPEAVEVAVHGRDLECDVGLVADRCFLNVSTGGFGAEATEEASSEVKRALGPLAYMITGARKFASLEVSRARFASEEEVVYEGNFLLFVVGNSRRTGGGNWLTPRARLDDGLLDLCVVKELPRLEFLALLPELRAGRHLDHPGVIYRQLPAVTVDSEQQLSVNADGEPLTGTHLEYRISPHHLVLKVP